ncbi:MAG: APC family permease [Vulcanimicrobiota bacterium]
MRESLGRADLVCLGLNCVVGSGIFLAPGSIAKNLGPASVPAIALAAALCLMIALCFAEMAATIEGTGGAFLYCTEAFGPRPGFMVGWVMWLSGLIGGASVAVGLGQYVHELWRAIPATAVALVTVGLLALLNYFGARAGALSNDILALLKFVPLVLFAAWALSRVAPSRVVGLPQGEDHLLGFLLILYAFSGFEWLAVPAGEVSEPQKSVPFALTTVLALAAVLYMAIQAGVVSLGLHGSDAPLAEAAKGTWLAGLVTFGGLASIASVNAAIAFTGPRSLWALAHQGWLPEWLARRHPSLDSPAHAVLATSAATAALVVIGNFELLARCTVLVSLLQYVATIGAVIRLRFTQPARPRPYRLPGGLTIPILALSVCVLLLATSQLQYIVGMAVALAAGWVLSFFGKARRAS